MRRLPLPTFLLAAPVLLAGAGCSSGLGIETDPTVFVTATAESPTVNVVNEALGTSVSGGFTLSLHLGARASGSSDVNIQGFQITTKDKNTVVVDVVPLEASNAKLPITLDPGGDEEVKLQINLGSDLLAKEVGQKLCNFSEMIYTGSLTDSLRGGTLPLDSDLVTVSGCVP